LGEILATLQIAAPDRRESAVEVTVLADSGSLHTVIQPSVVRRLELPLARHQSLATAGDEEIQGDLFYADVRVVPFDWHGHVHVFVPDEPFFEGLTKDQRTGALKRPEGLLGASLLQQGPYLLDFRRHRVARSG